MCELAEKNSGKCVKMKHGFQKFLECIFAKTVFHGGQTRTMKELAPENLTP